jgi:transposase InsO family protein
MPSPSSDQSSQFTGAAFTSALADKGITISMDGKGAWRDDVFVERLWRTIKCEEVYLRAYESVADARQSIIGAEILFRDSEPALTNARSQPPRQGARDG